MSGDKVTVKVALDTDALDKLEALAGNRIDAVLLSLVSKSATVLGLPSSAGPQPMSVAIELLGRKATGSRRTRIAGPGSPLGEVMCETDRGLTVRVPADRLLRWAVKMLGARGVKVTFAEAPGDVEQE